MRPSFCTATAGAAHPSPPLPPPRGHLPCVATAAAQLALILTFGHTAVFARGGNQQSNHVYACKVHSNSNEMHLSTSCQQAQS
jgi:hypothetical protein